MSHIDLFGPSVVTYYKKLLCCLFWNTREKNYHWARKLSSLWSFFTRKWISAYGPIGQFFEKIALFRKENGLLESQIAEKILNFVHKLIRTERVPVINTKWGWEYLDVMLKNRKCLDVVPAIPAQKPWNIHAIGLKIKFLLSRKGEKILQVEILCAQCILSTPPPTFSLSLSLAHVDSMFILLHTWWCSFL